MNKIKAALAVALLCSSQLSSANPGVFIGVVYAFGVDADVGYLSKDFAATAGWDFLQQGVQLGVGYVNTKDNNGAAPVVVPPPPPVL